MKSKLSIKLEDGFKGIEIKQLLKFVLYSSTAAILILAISSITIEKLSHNSHARLIENIIKTDTVIKTLNKNIKSLIKRNSDILLSESIPDIEAIPRRATLETAFKNDLRILEELLPDEDSQILIRRFKKISGQYLDADVELYNKQKSLIRNNKELHENSMILENLVNDIINAVDGAAGKIRLKAARTRNALDRYISENNPDKPPMDRELLETLLGRQQRVENASNNVQHSALQIVQLSRKLIQTSDRDALVSIKDNEISQEISQINISLDILAEDLKQLPEFLSDVSRVNIVVNKLINILINDASSLYNLRTQHLNLKEEIEALLSNKVDQYTNSMVSIINMLEERLDIIIADNKANTESFITYSYAFIIAITVLVVVFIAAVFQTLPHRISHPLSLIVGAVHNLMEGKLTSRLDQKDFARDEFWLVANTFNHFAQRNEDLINQLSSAHGALQENEQRLQAILENALVGIAHLVERRFISVNNRFEDMFGYERDAIIGLRTEILFSSRDDFEAVGKEAYSNFREGSVYRREWQLQHSNGNQFWCAISAKSIVAGKPELGTIWLYEDISEQKRTEEKLRTLANYDVLTGLPNRSLFMDRLGNFIDLARRQNQMIAVLFIDLDRFKQVNDSLGHDAGDKLLKLVANQLNSCVRSSDTIARLGGDEFTIIMVGINHKMVPARTANKIIRALSKPFFIDGQEVNISPSIGISMYPDDGTGVTELLRNADAAMYHAKQQGRNNYQFYADEMNAESLSKLTLESRLRRAVDKKDFELHFQKQFDVMKNKLIGYEALLRWQNEAGEYVPPDIFIPVLEDIGIINQVGEWIIFEACRCKKLLSVTDPGEVSISINLSALQFQDENLLEYIDTAVKQFKLKPQNLELEITESILMSGSQFSKNMLNDLHEYGCRIVLDDFGTGYSSLAYLKRFPIDVIKIDKSFIRDILTDPSDAAICDAIQAMANSLNIKVIAEGVETREQLDYLIANGITLVQGFYFGKAEPISKLLPADRKADLKLVN